jgi:Zn-dependent protease with chaperone function
MRRGHLRVTLGGPHETVREVPAVEEVESLRRGVAFRALLAFLLSFGYYALGLGLVACLLGLLYVQFRLTHQFHPKLTALCGSAALAILWSLLPRPQRFVAPGPKLRRDEHPELFDTIRSIARAAGQPEPKEVYLVRDLNAFVSQRGGLFGLGAKRYIGIGLPLLHVLTVSEFRGVVAHEFGHFCNEDTIFGAWTYRTWKSITIAVEGLKEHEVLRLPFVFYAKLFLRVATKVSRHQEYLADRIAVRIAGHTPFVRALRRLEPCSMLYGYYWTTHVGPALREGFLPPLLEGFDLLLRSRKGRLMARALQRLASEPSEFDSHPPTEERIRALGEPPGEEPPEDQRKAISLIRDPEGWEKALFAHALGTQILASLKPASWEVIGEEKTLRRWRYLLEIGESRAQALLRGLRIRELANRLPDLEQARKQGLPPFRVRDIDESQLDRELVTAVLGLTLHRRGWTVRALPGTFPVLVHGARCLDLKYVFGLAAKTFSPEEWSGLCDELGIADLELELPRPKGQRIEAGKTRGSP